MVTKYIAVDPDRQYLVVDLGCQHLAVDPSIDYLGISKTHKAWSQDYHGTNVADDMIHN